MNRIDIVITQSPAVDVTTPPLERSNLTNEATGFSWTIAAQGGFKTASIDLVVPRARAFEILNNFLSKRVIFTTPTALHPTQIAWEGMVYQISIDDGKRTVTRSMANVYNRVEVVYSSTDYSQTTPQGAQVRSYIDNNTTSQALYGLRWMVYTVGEMNSADANRLGIILDYRYAYPLTVMGGESVGDVPNLSTAKVRIDCTGYIETLDKYIYKDQSTPTTTFDIMIQSLLNTFAVAGPTTIIKTDYTNITANALGRSEYQIKNITALDYINDICAYGSDLNFTEQCFFGVLEDRTAYYTPSPSAISYWMSIFDQSERIYNAVDGSRVAPWNMRPGRIISIGDLLPDGPSYDLDVTGVESFVIGEVKFTAPNKVELIPWNGDPTQVILHRIGIGAV